MTQKYRLLAPGPVQLAPEVKESLALPMIHHRTPEFTEILKSALQELKIVFQTDQPVMILSSTGSGAMEAALVNTLSMGDEVLAVCGGKFGERWAEMAEAFQMKVHRLDVEWGAAVNPQTIEQALKENPSIRAVLLQACETSTATLHPVKEVAEVLRDYKDCLLMVDGITAVGAMDLPMDDWDIDVLIGGSQKAFMLPPGLAMIALSERAWKASESGNCPRFYFDIRKERAANQKGQTFFSSSVSLIRALNFVLNSWNEVGLINQFDRCRQLAEWTRNTAKALGLEIFSQAPSPSVTALKVPDGIDGDKLRRHIEQKYLITFMGGQEHLKGQILRIGHIGSISNEDMRAGMQALGEALIDFSFQELDADKLKKVLSSAENSLPKELSLEP